MSFSNKTSTTSSWLLGGLSNIPSGLGGTLTDGLSGVLGKALGGLGTAADAAKGAVSKAGDVASTLLKGAAGAAIPAVVSAGKTAVKAISDSVTNPTLRSVAGGALNVAKGLAELSQEAAKVAASPPPPNQGPLLPEQAINPLLLQTSLWGGIGLVWILLWWLL